MRNINVTFFILAVLIVSSACGKLGDLDKRVAGAIQGKVNQAIEEKLNKRPEAAQESPAPALPVSEKQPMADNGDDALLRELNGYIECLNRAVPRAEDSFKRYLSWVNKQSGPTCKEPYISWGLYSLYEDSIQKCNDAAEKGKSGGPSLPDLEAAAGELAACNASLVPLVKKVDDYYEQQDYRDDACAKGKELHPQLVAAFEKCLGAAKRLSMGVDNLKEDLDIRRLAKLDQAGASFQAEVLRVLVASNGLIKAIHAEGAGPLVNKEAFVPKCQELEKTYQKLDDYTTAHKDEVDKAFWGSSFVGSAKGFNGAAKFLRRALEDNKDPREEVRSFIETYNRMISDSNNLRF